MATKILESCSQNQNFTNLIAGKKVAIVGPAAYLHRSGRGAQIDSADLVVRVNRGVETTQNHAEDVGRKTDILYSCLLETSRNAGIIEPSLLHQSGVKVICVPGFTCKNFWGTSTYTNHQMIARQTWKKLKNCGLYPPRLIPKKTNSALEEATNTRPNTGFLAIYDLLAAAPRTLAIFGFSFYLDGFFPGTKAGVNQEGFRSEDEFGSLARASKRHNQAALWRYARNTLTKNSRVQLDVELRRILSLETFPSVVKTFKVS